MITLIGDVSGTHTTLAIVKKNRISQVYEFQTQEYDQFETLLYEYLNIIQLKPRKAILACAGRIENNACSMTNSPFQIIGKKLEKKFKFNKVTLVNDFTALAYSTLNLKKENTKIIQKGTNSKKNKILILGAGTGLGVCYLDKTHPKNYNIVESEAGSIGISTTNKKEEKIKEFLQKKLKRKRIIYDDILSGKGIEHLYEYYSKKKLSAHEISKIKKTNTNAKKTFQIFYVFYARFTREMALTFLPDSIYLAGGIIEHNLSLSIKEFKVEYSNTIRFESYLKSLPITIIKNYDASLYGLKNYNLRF